VRFGTPRALSCLLAKSSSSESLSLVPIQLLFHRFYFLGYIVGVSVKGKQATAKVDRPTSICSLDCGSQAVKYRLAISRCLDKPLFP